MILKTLKMASGSIFFECNCKFKDTKYVQTMQLMIYLCLFKRCLAQSFQCLSLKDGEIGVSSSTITYRISIVLGNLGKKVVRLGTLKEKAQVITIWVGKSKAKQNVPQQSSLVVTLYVTFLLPIGISIPSMMVEVISSIFNSFKFLVNV